MKKVVFIIVIVFPLTAFCQNLLVNGGFEDENICTEYHEPCAPEGWFGNTGGFKNYFNDPALAYEGTHYLAIEAGRTRNKFQRSYTRVQLICNLRAGSQYILQAYMKSANSILDSIGIYFTSYDFICDKNPLNTILPTAYIIDQNKPVRGNTSWQKISFNYTATGDEKFLTIANFSKKDINGETGLPMETRFVVFLDALSLTPVNPDEKLCADWEKARTLIYEMNDRHEFFERYVRFYRSQNKIAPAPKLSLTRIFKNKKLLLTDDMFTPGRTNLQPPGYALLDKLLDNLSNQGTEHIEIGSYQDDKAVLMATDEIAVQRASSIKEYIMRKLSIDEKKIGITDGQKNQTTPIKTQSNVTGKKRTVMISISLYE